MRLPEIIGVAGTNGAGKDTLARIRTEIEGAGNVSLSDILRGELDKRGLAHERENLRAVGNELRAQFGPGVLATRAVDEYHADGTKQGLSLTSVRTIGEAEAIKQAGGSIVWVDADRKIRYERVIVRGQGRASDQKTFDEFCAEEDIEMYPPEDEKDKPDRINMAAVRDMADIVITNEFADATAYEDYLKAEFEIGLAN